MVFATSFSAAYLDPGCKVVSELLLFTAIAATSSPVRPLAHLTPTLPHNAHFRTFF
jgi:hypothetical protein